MGNSQSNSINDNVKQIIEQTVTSSDSPKGTPVEIKFTENKEKPKTKFVQTETEVQIPKLVAANNKPELPTPVAKIESATSPGVPQNVLLTPTSDGPPKPIVLKDSGLPLSTSTSPIDETLPKVPLSATSPVLSSVASPAAPPVASPKRSPISPRRRRNKKGCDNITVVVLSPGEFESLTKTPETPKKGGYSYAGEVSDIYNGSIETKFEPLIGGQPNLISLDANIFESSELSGGEQEEKKSTEFNPEHFFNEMQQGGMLGERPHNKEHKKNKIERYLSPDRNTEDSNFDFGEATEGLDIDENEDTEDIKHKVMALRAMVSRSKAKKGKKGSKKGSKKRSKKGSKKAKRMTEQSGGISENSVSEYLNSTSSISTSDVRLISMNKMRK